LYYLWNKDKNLVGDVVVQGELELQSIKITGNNHRIINKGKIIVKGNVELVDVNFINEGGTVEINGGSLNFLYSNVDKLPPFTPIVNEITETSTSVSGIAEAGSTITVKVGTTVIGTSTATTEGKYTVTIERQKAGTVISVTATDEAGNVSELKVTSISVSVEVDLLPQQQENRFPDVTFYKDEITYLTGKKIITGYPDGTFKPKQNLTRLQAVTMILREKGITNFTPPNPNFTDMKPGSYGYEIVAKAVQLGFIGGKTASDGSKFFDPSAPLTRGQMAKILSEGYNLQKTSDVPFIDVSANNGYKDYISTLATENITTGYADGSFKSTVNLSRAHFAVFMARLLDDKFKIVTSTKSES